jgi:hypothetical protein
MINEKIEKAVEEFEKSNDANWVQEFNKVVDVIAEENKAYENPELLKRFIAQCNEELNVAVKMNRNSSSWYAHAGDRSFKEIYDYWNNLRQFYVLKLNQLEEEGKLNG